MSWITRLKNAVNPSRLDQDLADEIHDHIDRRACHLEEQGLSRDEARRLAARAFGNQASIRGQSRELRLSAALESTCQDVRYACRGLLRNPVFAATAIVTLSLAIGANTAVYSIVEALLLRPLQVPQADRLVTFSTTGGEQAAAFSYPLYQELRAAAAGSARLALFDAPNRVEAQLGLAGAPPEEVVEQFVSPDAFEVLGVPAAAGELFSPARDRFPAPREALVLSYEYWQRRFGADPAVLGQHMIVNGRSFSILGVARMGFSGAEPGKFVDVWLPVTLADTGIFTQSEFRPFRLLGRLSPGTTRERLAAQLQSAFHHHQEGRIGSGTSMPPVVQKQLREETLQVQSGATGLSGFRQAFSRPLWILLVVAASILLIACANVASLLLARSMARSGEMSVRVSLGAWRSRLVRQFLTESLLLALLAGLGGWVMARASAPLLVTMVSKPSDPVRLDLALDTRTLLFCAGVCALSTLLFGLAPAWVATGARSLATFRTNTVSPARVRLGRLLVAVQVAFAFCLVTGGTGFLVSLRNLTSVDTGFNANGVTVLTIVNDLGPQQRERQLALTHELQRRAAALPNVQGAATAWMPVFSGGRRAQRVVLPGQPLSPEEVTFYRVSPGFLAVLRTPLLSGRDLTFRDNDDEPVATIVNRAFARKYFGSESVLGREFRRDDGVRHQVVGLAANARFSELRGGPEPIAYMPMKPPRSFTLYVRSTLDAGSVSLMVAREAQALGSGMRVRNALTLGNLVGSTILTEKLLAAIGGTFAFLGLVLSATGLFGILNYAVTRRTREMGIRAALGARKAALYGLVLRDVTGTLAGGLAVGLAASVGLMRFARSLLFGVQPVDPLVIGTAIAAFGAAAILAGGIPARRASRVDPVIALRHQ